MGVSERRLRERQRRRTEILHAAAEVFSERGLEGASMDAIATRAELGKATLYYYFPNKQALFDAVLATGIKRFFLELDATAPPAGDLASAVAELLHSYLRFFESNQGLLHLMAPYLAQLNLASTLPDNLRGDPQASPSSLMVPHQAYLARMDDLLADTPWDEHRHEFMAFLTDIIVALSQSFLDGHTAATAQRVEFYVDLIRGRVATGTPYGS